MRKAAASPTVKKKMGSSGSDISRASASGLHLIRRPWRHPTGNRWASLSGRMPAAPAGHRTSLNTFYGELVVSCRPSHRPAVVEHALAGGGIGLIDSDIGVTLEPEFSWSHRSRWARGRGHSYAHAGHLPSSSLLSRWRPIRGFPLTGAGSADSLHGQLDVRRTTPGLESSAGAIQMKKKPITLYASGHTGYEGRLVGERS
jgi:hypothetical protein